MLLINLINFNFKKYAKKKYSGREKFFNMRKERKFKNHCTLKN